MVTLDGTARSAGTLSEVNGAELVVANRWDAPRLPDALRRLRRALRAGALRGGALTCPACGERFDLPLAGTLAGRRPLQLAPVPLLAAAHGGEGGARR